MPSCAKSFQITVGEAVCLIDNDSPLPNGTVGTISTIQLMASAATSPYTFSVIAGALPTGATMNSAGLITINAVAPATTTFTVKATDSTLPTPIECSKAFSLAIVAANQPAWASLLWGQSTGGGSGSFAPNNAAFASFLGSTASTPSPTWANAGSRQNTAALTSVTPWTGIARLSINASRVNSSGSATVTVTMNAVLVASFTMTVDSEVVNLDFSVAGGTSIAVAVQMASVAGVQGGPSVSGAFSNL